MSIRRYKKISELDALTSASLDTYVAGVSNGTTVKIELDVLADGVLDRINALDIQRLNSLESFTSSYTNDSSSFNSRINNLIEGEVSLPVGVISSSQQITDFGFISESVDISSLNSFTSSYFTTSESIDSRLNSLESNTGSYETTGRGILSGSISYTSLTDIPEGIVSGSDQLTSSLNELYVISGSITQTTWDNIANKPNDIISSSAQITTYGFVSGSYETTGRNILSGSILDLLPNGIVSGSEQVLGGSDVWSGSAQLPSGVVSGSLQVLGGSGVYSSSAQIEGFETIGRDIISSSIQIESLGFVTASQNVYVTTQSFYEFTQSFYQFTGSVNGTFVTTASFNDYTASISTASLVDRLNALEANTGSYETTGRNILSGSILDLLPIGTITSSTQITTLGFISESVDISGLNLFTQSAEQRIGNLEAATSSYLTSLSGAISSSEQILGGSGILSGSVSYNDLTNIPNDIISSSAQITTLGFVSGSYETTGREIISSSNQIEGLGYATTSSLNSFTASYITDSSSLDSRLDILEAYSSSQLVPTASVSNRTLQTDVYVKNSSGAQIDKGKVVRIVGAVGDNPLIVTASFLTEGQSANTLGITTENIVNDSFGWVITEGVLLGVNTIGMNAGQLLFLGENGTFTVTPPIAPNHGVRLGEVLREQQNNGSIYVRIDNGSELGEVHDVVDTSTTSSYGDILMKSGSVWVNNSTFSSSVDSRINSINNIVSQGVPTGTISGSSQITALGFITASTSPVGTISGSSQITSFGFVSGSYETTGRGILSGSITSLLPSGVVSSSIQVLGGSGVVSGSYETTGRGILSGSITNLLPTGVVSSSVQTIVNLPIGTISSSTQIAGLGYAITGSNTFIGNEIISGTLNVSGSFTSSLQTGYAWVGNGSNVSVAFPTSSLLSTASFNSWTGSTFNSLSSSVSQVQTNLNAVTASLGATSNAFNYTGVVNPTNYVLSSYTTSSYNGGTIDIVIVNTTSGTATSANYQFASYLGTGGTPQENGSATSGPGSPNPSFTLAVSGSNMNIRISLASGTYNIKGVIRLF
jgi:hypothetical protein